MIYTFRKIDTEDWFVVQGHIYIKMEFIPVRAKQNFQ